MPRVELLPRILPLAAAASALLRPGARGLVLCGLLGALAVLPPAAARAACVDEDNFDAQPLPAIPPGSPGAAAGGAASPRQALLDLVQDALARSHGIGAARLMTEAAESDVQEAKAAKQPQASLTGALAPALSSSSTNGVSSSGSQLQASAGVVLSQVFYDGGRADRLIDWRRHQAEATRLGMLSTQEQIGLSAASMALERSRYRMQAAIYAQNVRKMGCLVQALETIVASDKGRMSELIQARKQMQQAELQQVQSVTQARQVEARLRRMVGDGLGPVQGLSTLMLQVPQLPDVLTAAERSTDIEAMDANARALREAARAVEAGTRPQVAWNLSGSTAVGGGSNSTRAGALSAGMTVSIPLLNPAVDHSMQAARKRAEAAALQRAEALEQRRQRIVDVHEQALSAFDRLGRISNVLKDSDRLRNFTLQQWQQLGRRSLFDVISAESEHYNLRVQYINALHDGQQMNMTLTSLGSGLMPWLQSPVALMPRPGAAGEGGAAPAVAAATGPAASAAPAAGEGAGATGAASAQATAHPATAQPNTAHPATAVTAAAAASASPAATADTAGQADAGRAASTVTPARSTPARSGRVAATATATRSPAPNTTTATR